VITPDAPDRVYSTRLRTALILTGSGTAGAYHAGVLRAFQEAGIKIDFVAGRGIGAVAAMFAAVDGGARLWEDNGMWRSGVTRDFYDWRRPLKAAVWALIAAGIILAVPLVLLAFAVVMSILGMLLTLVGLAGIASTITAAYTRWIEVLFAPAMLPTIVPRLVLLAVLVAAGILVATALSDRFGAGARRRSRQGIIGRAFGGPLSAVTLEQRCVAELWNLIRGAAPLSAPASPELGRKYLELLAENFGQPGFRELLVTVHDLDARRDLVFGLFGAPQRQRFFTRPVPADAGHRQVEVFDLAGIGRDHLLDALSAALALPIAAEPHLIRFAPEDPWRGETHRVCDRPGAITRLIEEVAAAGAEQVILVSASPLPARPHELSSGRADIRGRAGEHIAAFEAASLRDVVEHFTGRFAGLFVVRPPYNPLGPLDFRGVYDERSDRTHTLTELIDRGYEDAYRQFIEPIVGASGERIATVQR
jgi:hypothetical protein